MLLAVPVVWTTSPSPLKSQSVGDSYDPLFRCDPAMRRRMACHGATGSGGERGDTSRYAAERLSREGGRPLLCPNRRKESEDKGSTAGAQDEAGPY